MSWGDAQLLADLVQCPGDVLGIRSGADQINFSPYTPDQRVGPARVSKLLSHRFGPAYTLAPARLVLGFTPTGAVHIAVRDNIVDDEIIVETVYRPSPDLWAPDLKTRRRLR